MSSQMVRNLTDVHVILVWVAKGDVAGNYTLTLADRHQR